MLNSSWLFRLQQAMSQIWIKVSAYSALSVLTAFIAVWLRPFIPSDLAFRIGADAVETILNIVATSMLTVATFSMGIMASAISGAANGATPRATSLLLDDRVSQNALATFLGAFVFSLVGIISLQIGIYEDGGRVVLLAVTVFVIFLIYVAFIRWINVLRSFGRIPDTLSRVESAVEEALQRRLAHPYLDCNAMAVGTGSENPNDLALHSDEMGFVQHIDVPRLQELAKKHDLTVRVNRATGQFGYRTRPLAHIRTHAEDLSDNAKAELVKCFTIGATRTFKQDPQFGMIVLAETASRALSPAVNDPGTAIDVLRRALRILMQWQERSAPVVLYDRVWMPGLDAADFLRDLIRPIARDGAGLIEVQHILQAMLRDLAHASPSVFAAAAHAQSREALKRAEATLTLESELAELREIAQQIVPHESPTGHKAI